MGTKPKVKREHSVKLWRELSDGRWHLRREINMQNRMIRAVCEAHPEHFLSSQKGYKLVKFATREEIEISIKDLRSRIRHMEARADGLEQALHSRIQQQLFAKGIKQWANSKR